MSTPPISFPAGIDAATFLRDYWQQRPLLMRGALPADMFPVAADELAGLACEEEIESRLIIEDARNGWQVRHGPFDDDDFAALPESHWTLLVQDVDKYLPEVAELIAAFDVVPSWRIDDIMISYAADQGGVGPHTDAYDVFLIQAAGKRRWRLSFAEYSDADLVPDIEQRILARFETDRDWVLEPGDVLYLPPGVAHWGTADGGDCMTYSLGFRAPSQRDLAGDWFQYLVSRAGDRRLADPTALSPDNPAELSDDVIDAARRLLAELPGLNADAFADWFGCHVTEPKPQFQILPRDVAWTTDDLAAFLRSDGALLRHPAARLAWSRATNDTLRLFCQGESQTLPGTLQVVVRRVTERRRLAAADLRADLKQSQAAASLILQLVNVGVLEPVDDN